jgi:leucyl-tRNA synthetase
VGNWCPKDKIGLANEEVVDGKCERCGTAVEQKEKEQWMLTITKYAERLDKDLDTVDFLPQIKVQQRHWIGNLRDWVFSRQRYWGEPIPMIYCEKCNWQPVPEEQLPVTLPEVERYEPTDTGESPLATIADWVNTKCPKCGGVAKRETDTMPNWAGSSWYWLAYVTKNTSDQSYDLKNRAALDYWTPVDWYNGGMEHTTLHLLYSRFWHKFLFDIGLVPTSEPYAKRTSHGLILAGDGEKMSKSRGNVVNPDAIIKLYGADTLRVYEMFMGPFEQMAAWNTDSIIGSRRFLERVWLLSEKVGEMEDSQEIKALLNQTVQKVSSDIEAMKFNTAISTMMVLVNKLSEADQISAPSFSVLLKLLAPFAPHMCEELWQQLGNTTSITFAPWPEYDASLVVAESGEVVIQINGVVRDKVAVPADFAWDEAELKKLVLERPNVKKFIEGKEVGKFVVVKNRLVNIVV